MLFKALNPAFIERRIQSQRDDDAHQTDALDQRLGRQLLRVEPMHGDPVAAHHHRQTAQAGQRHEDQFERAQQAAGVVVLHLAALLVRNRAHQTRRQPCVQQLQPGLQDREETDQAIRLGAHVTEVERHDQDSHQQGVGLSCIAQRSVAYD